ncbi:MazG family protein [Actinopolyspora mortivallis]|uniref:MazG family protein n=1 Tax=Actinopolyspora mortivallis TaxID=33906 RepID=UPI00037754AC|nr:MazG family protein [Actinopolyspora mortivallis]
MNGARQHHPATSGSTVVLVDDRLGDAVPARAFPALRAASVVYADRGLAESTRRCLEALEPPHPGELLERAAREAVVLVAAEETSPPAAALLEAGAAEIRAQSPTGVELLDAVTVMDRLRSPGGCPWDAEQTHESLRTYLVEETYELLDALERGDRAAMREELGDVLLQVLFHARVAAEDAEDPFDVDTVATELVGKLVSRHPHVFAGDGTVHDAESQHARWEELKQVEKRRESSVDGVALGQPAVALAAKLAQRARRAGVPGELFPRGGDVGRELFRLAAEATEHGTDPEDALRAVARDFDERIRAAETDARAAGLDPAALSGQQWHEHWPRR